MEIVHIVLWLVVAGVCLYLIQAHIPMAQSIKTIINVVVILAVCLWLLGIFGLPTIRIH